MTVRSLLARDAYLSIEPVAQLTSSGQRDELCILSEQITYAGTGPAFFSSDENIPSRSQSLLVRTEWQADPVYVTHLPGGSLYDTFIPCTSEGVVYHDLATHAGRHVLPGWVTQGEDNTRYAQLEEKEPIQLLGKYALLFFSHACGLNHSHWLLQTVPKVQMFRESGVMPDFYIVSPTIQQYQRDTLHTLGISDDQIFTPPPNKTLYFEHLYVSYTGNDIHPDLRVYDELINKIEDTSLKGPEKIYVSRKDARSMRRFLNEDAMIECATANGFTIVTPSSLSLSDEINIFRNAKVIAGPIGAGIYNALFTRPGATIIAMSDPAYVMDWPLQLASLRSHRIIHLLGNSFLSDEPIHQGTHNSWVLDPQNFQRTLEKAL